MTPSLLQQYIEIDFSINKQGSTPVFATGVQLPTSAIIVNSFVVCVQPIVKTGTVTLNIGTSFNANLFANNLNSSTLNAQGITVPENTDLRFMDNTNSVLCALSGGGKIQSGIIRVYVSYYNPASILSNVVYVPSPGGSIGGSGTLNMLAKFTPNGTHIGDSEFFDDGTNVGLNTVTPLAKLHIKSNGSTVMTTAFQIDDSTNLPIFIVNDFGAVGINAVPTIFPLEVWGFSNLNSKYTAQFHDSTGSNNSFTIRDDGHLGFGTLANNIVRFYFVSTAALDYGHFNNLLNINSGGAGSYFNVTGQSGSIGVQVDMAATAGNGKAIQGNSNGPAAAFNTGIYGTARDGTAQSIGVNGIIPTGGSPVSYAGYFENHSTGAVQGFAGYFLVDNNNAGATNIAAFFQASNGLTNYAILVPANGGSVGLGTMTPDPSAIVDVQSLTQGLRVPNMTTVQKNAIAAPAKGLIVYDTTLDKLCVFTTGWETITSI